MRWMYLSCRLLMVGYIISLSGIATAQKTINITPSYRIEAIQIEGNTKTKEYLIRRALGLSEGEHLAVDDPRFELARYRVLSLGYFSDVRLKLKKGSSRGQAILMVDVVERGTIILTDLFLGASEATKTWGGFGLADTNFLGRGYSLEGAFVLGADPEVERGVLQQSYRLRVSKRQLGTRALSVAGSYLYLDGSDFFRRAGPPSSAEPSDLLSIRYHRIGGSLEVGSDVARYTRVYVGYRGEAVRSDIPVGAVQLFPNGGGEAIDFGLADGNSVLSILSLIAVRDTRNDPVLPQRGSWTSVAAEISNGLIGSTYDYFKLSARYDHFFLLRWNHVIALQLQGGTIAGQAPFFEKFFIGDFNDLIPGRSLGLNFSTLPSRNIFHTSINEKRYEEIAFRISGEYIIPWFRGGKIFYGGDFFVNLGVLALTSRETFRVRDRSFWEALPIDLTMDAGIRLDTQIGIFRLSIGNGLGRIPF
jgi:outer membrane protein assembly factor BamA